jgi:tRNA(fMet)-specific endonuclease VapC
MDYILLDTCIVVHILRNNEYSIKCKEALKKFSETPHIILSVVSKAELESLSKQQNWGEQRKMTLAQILNEATFIDIENADENLITAYSNIDTYSKRKGNDKFGNILNNSAKTMHKNDLWIAATAFTLNIPLLTTDGDFDHLNGTMIKVMQVK